MPKINFSFIFDNEFERVFDTFSESQVFLDLALQNLFSKFVFFKGNRFSEENSEFLFCWKNYYRIKVVVEKAINEKLFKTYTLKTTNIDKIPIQLSFIFQFFWDSVNEKTIFILIIEYSDDFFTELIKNDFTDDDKTIICKKIEEYLNESIKGLETEFTCILNAPLEQARKYILNPKLFFKIITKEVIYTNNEHDIFLDEKYEMLAKIENSSNLIPLTILIVDSFIISEFYIKVIYKTYKKISFPNIKIKFIYKQLANKKTFIFCNIKSYEPITHEMNRKLFNFWKKRMLDFHSFFEKNNKNKINLSK